MSQLRSGRIVVRETVTVRALYSAYQDAIAQPENMDLPDALRFGFWDRQGRVHLIINHTLTVEQLSGVWLLEGEIHVDFGRAV